MFVEIRGVGPAAVFVVQVEHGTFADVDEEADVVGTSVWEKGMCVSDGIRTCGEGGASHFSMCWLHPPTPFLLQQVAWLQKIVPQKRQSVGSTSSFPVVGHRRLIVSYVSVS